MVSDLHQPESVCGNTKLKCTESLGTQGGKESRWAGGRESPLPVGIMIGKPAVEAYDV